MKPITHVRQEDTFGCTYAALAMVLGRTYADIRDELGDPGRGKGEDIWIDYFGLRGYAVQFFWRSSQLENRDRACWPFEPWADVHICGVSGGGHIVVMLRDGRILDPYRDKPSRLHDYDPGRFSWMAAIYRVEEGPRLPVSPRAGD